MKEGEAAVEIFIHEDKKLSDSRIEIYCPEVSEEILDIVAKLRVYDKKITGVSGEGTYIVEVSEILYVESVDKRTFFYTEKADKKRPARTGQQSFREGCGEGVYETPLRLYELEERLGKSDFFRASKSTIINFNQIQSLRPDFGGRMLVQMKNGEKLYVSRQYVPVLKRKLGL